MDLCSWACWSHLCPLGWEGASELPPSLPPASELESPAPLMVAGPSPKGRRALPALAARDVWKTRCYLLMFI